MISDRFLGWQPPMEVPGQKQPAAGQLRLPSASVHVEFEGARDLTSHKPGRSRQMIGHTPPFPRHPFPFVPFSRPPFRLPLFWFPQFLPLPFPTCASSSSSLPASDTHPSIGTINCQLHRPPLFLRLVKMNASSKLAGAVARMGAKPAMAQSMLDRPLILAPPPW